MIKNYDDAINFIHGRHKWSKTNTFERITNLLQALGNPQDQLQYVHITGTNGKGSVARMTEQLLMEHGLKVGLFTSPFIMRFNERIQVDNVPISDEDLTRTMQQIEPILLEMDRSSEVGGVTEFETLTALMFVYFAQQSLDVVVLEVGIGGMWDTTNVIPNKLVAVITTIGLDHQKILGQTMTEIAQQKAGIIKHVNQPTVIGRLPKLVLPVINQKTHQLYQLGKFFKAEQIQQNRQGAWNFAWLDQSGRHFEDLTLPLLGMYQLDNAAVALEVSALTLQALGRSMQEKSIKSALNQVQWPARFEQISRSPEIILDGAHNLAGIQALVQTLRQKYRNESVIVIMGVLADKNYQQMLAELANEPWIKVIVVNFDAPNQRQAIDPHRVVNELAHQNISVGGDWQSVLDAELAKNIQAKIIISGSLYFVSEVRQVWVSTHSI
ncbi:bifunctional folylpolyglutamate synthase/dihydrofolate synthase [Weissella coleopterorum]|uniref:tetrahydrofolate synthase n=1 Tax=Weissella coleopterorum TaxID=2714949 RepID=A0A6G8AZK1_9LACO|nr:folylpolyglutamate synthase/dihydrofolate synthase family protein [Weissella coleopterorum]QIL50410.1 bifunctional folylpolyglutamate synthase/dihydrofolate synthase [Weissella coleopterorum]